MKKFFILLCLPFLAACGFHLQGEIKLAPPLKHLYLQTSDPYGTLAQNLQQYLKMSHVELVDSPNKADTILVIKKDDTSEIFLSVNGTQLTRQYNLVVTVVFEITDKHGRVLLPEQQLAESKPITIQSNQILGGSTEANLYYQQMRHILAYAIMNRIASNQVTDLLTKKQP